MDNLIIKNFENEKIRDICTEIQTLFNGMQRNAFLIAEKFYELYKNEKLLKDEGYDSIIEFAEDIFRLKKTQTYNLINIGKRFSRNGSCILGDYNTSQLQELLPIKDNRKINKMIKDGIITEDMEAKTIRKIVKEEMKEKIESPEVVPEKTKEMVIENTHEEIEIKNIYLNITINKNNEQHYFKSYDDSPDWVQISEEEFINIVKTIVGGNLL